MMQPHALLLPYPETGHINPLMELAKLLASHGVLITFVNTQYNHHRILHCNQSHLPSDLGLPIRLVDIPDGLSDTHNRDNDIYNLNHIITHIGPALEKLIDKLAADGERITCIISDVMALQTLDVAKKLGIPRVAFWPPSASVYAYCCHGVYGASQGAIPRNGVLQLNEIISFPGVLPLPGRKVPWMIDNEVVSEALFASCKRSVEALLQSEWVLCNSVHDLELDAEHEMPPGYQLLCSVGPILPPDVLDMTCAKDKRITASLWLEEDACLEWLDTQVPNSVLYVSLGSIAKVNKEQLHEFAYGLEAVGLPILWVVRADMTGKKGITLPEGLLERNQERLRVVAWAPQLLVLSHVAVGGFLTHCGWNSTIEALSMGVPMLAWPQMGDQFANAELVAAKWGVGLELNVGAEGFVGRESVKTQVRKLMQGVEGRMMRAKAEETRQLILKATREGGSSYDNLQAFVKWVKHQAQTLPAI